MSFGLHTLMRGGGVAALAPELFPGAAFYVDTSRSVITKANANSGTGASLTKAGATITLSGATGLVTSHAGGTITLAGYGAGNNGKFTLLTATTGGGTFTNAGGASEAGSGSKTWAMDGQCVGLTDLVSGATLTQPGAITAQMAVCTSDNPTGKPVLGQATTGNRWVSVDDTAIAGKLNGTGPFTWFTYFTPITLTGSGWTVAQYRDTAIGVSPGSMAQFQVVLSANNGRSFYLSTNLANGTTWNMGGTISWTLGQWYSLAARYDGATTADWYVDGAFFASGSASPARTLTALRTVTVGMFAGSNANPSSIGGGKIAGYGVWKSDLGAARIAALHAYYRGWQP